jgi:hypothetical protein
MKVRGTRSVAFQSRERLRCVIVENGSLSLSEAGAGDFDETIVIAQMPCESGPAFAERVAGRLSSLERTRKCADTAVMLVGSDNGALAVESRLAVLGSLSRHVRARGEAATLTLMTSQNADVERLGLAEALLALPSSERVAIKVHFSQPRAA